MQHWPDWGSAKALEKSFTGMTRHNKLLRHVISFVESHTFSGQNHLHNVHGQWSNCLLFYVKIMNLFNLLFQFCSQKTKGNFKTIEQGKVFNFLFLTQIFHFPSIMEMPFFNYLSFEFPFISAF